MYIVSTFQYSEYLELAISELELRGIPRKKILAIPLEKNVEARKVFDTIQTSDGISLIDVSTILGTALMVLGVIYGYIWKWGPIIWGLIGLLGGAALGFLLDILPKKGPRSKNKVEKNTSDVILMIECNKTQVEMLRSILLKNLALGIGSLERKE